MNTCHWTKAILCWYQSLYVCLYIFHQKTGHIYVHVFGILAKSSWQEPTWSYFYCCSQHKHHWCQRQRSRVPKCFCKLQRAWECHNWNTDWKNIGKEIKKTHFKIFCIMRRRERNLTSFCVCKISRNWQLMVMNWKQFCLCLDNLLWKGILKEWSVLLPGKVELY